MIARSGWSKAQGFEIYILNDEAGLKLYDEFFKIGDEFNLKPGCPHLIERIESGLLSYGNDIDINDNPLQRRFLTLQSDMSQNTQIHGRVFIYPHQDLDIQRSRNLPNTPLVLPLRNTNKRTQENN